MSSPQQGLATCQDNALQAKVQEFWLNVMLPPYIFGRIIFLSNNHNFKLGMLCIFVIRFSIVVSPTRPPFFGHTAWHVGHEFPNQRLNPYLLHWEPRILTTGLPGKSLDFIFGEGRIQVSFTLRCNMLLGRE